MIHVDETRVPAWIDRKIQELERLAADLRRIRSRTGPTADELFIAPLLDRYELVESTMFCLEGYPADGARSGDQKAQSPQVFVFAPTLGWALTLSGFCRLGAAKDESEGAPKGQIDPE